MKRIAFVLFALLLAVPSVSAQEISGECLSSEAQVYLINQVDQILGDSYYSYKAQQTDQTCAFALVQILDASFGEEPQDLILLVDGSTGQILSNEIPVISASQVVYLGIKNDDPYDIYAYDFAEFRVLNFVRADSEWLSQAFGQSYSKSEPLARPDFCGRPHDAQLIYELSQAMEDWNTVLDILISPWKQITFTENCSESFKTVVVSHGTPRGAIYELYVFGYVQGRHTRIPIRVYSGSEMSTVSPSIYLGVQVNYDFYIDHPLLGCYRILINQDGSITTNLCEQMV